jgi:hypothetical protein
MHHWHDKDLNWVTKSRRLRRGFKKKLKKWQRCGLKKMLLCS